MACDATCGGCRNGCSTRHLDDIEDMDKSQLLELLKKKDTDLKNVRTALRTVQGQVAELSLDSHHAECENSLRSADWFGRTDDPGMKALYVERYLNWGYTREELCSGKPIIGIAQSGSDLAPCNRHHIELAKRVREGIRSAGAIAFEFPTHPIQETGRRPTAALDRNLAAMALAEVLMGYPLDGVVLLTGCDKTTPAFLMAAAQVNIPAICLNVGPMLNGWSRGSRVGSGSVIWKARELHAAGEINDDQFVDMVADGTPSPGHCNTMGTALTMNTLTEALGMALPGSAAIPAPYRQRSHAAYETGLRIVDLVRKNIRPRDILTREAFENAIVVNTAIGGSTNAPIHLLAVAAHLGVPIDMEDWDELGFHVPLIVNMQPAGEMLSEDYYHAGGLPAVIAELVTADILPHPEAMTVNGKTLGENAQGKATWDRRTIKTVRNPLKKDAGFLHLHGNLFDSAIMKMSVASGEFRKEFLEDPRDPNAFTCDVAVFDGPEDYKARLDKADIHARTILIMRGVGPLGYPGAAEVVNMHAPSALLKQGIRDLPCIGDGRQSGTSGSPSILNASPEAADGGNLALVRDGDKVRVDLNKRRVDLMVTGAVLEARRKELDEQGGYRVPRSQTYWQDLHRREVGPLSEGGGAVVAVSWRNSHTRRCKSNKSRHPSLRQKPSRQFVGSATSDLSHEELEVRDPIETPTIPREGGTEISISDLRQSHLPDLTSLNISPSNRPISEGVGSSSGRQFKTTMNTARLFVASLGNPAPYQNTRHSAGHVLLKALQSHLNFPALKKSKLHAGGLVSSGSDVGRPEYTLWQSPSLMNVSGPGLLKAYKQFIADSAGSSTDGGLPGLVVLHDEMETAPGQLRARSGHLSARGHNGIKSVQQSLQSAGLLTRLTDDTGNGGKFIKIGVGIGRPAGGSRDREEVSAYVLGKFGTSELATLAGTTGTLIELLEGIRAKI
ncbi:hypothetical protein JX266_010892 [Neoarthrinium moseri]|nr:hypothetical protein JX266_010892 [Neoarthrinium moseri]